MFKDFVGENVSIIVRGNELASPQTYVVHPYIYGHTQEILCIYTEQYCRHYLKDHTNTNTPLE